MKMVIGLHTVLFEFKTSVHGINGLQRMGSRGQERLRYLLQIRFLKKDQAMATQAKIQLLLMSPKLVAVNTMQYLLVTEKTLNNQVVPT